MKSYALPTVKIVHPEVEGEFVIINESDFQEGVHVRWDDREQRPSRKPATPAASQQGSTPAAELKAPDGCSVKYRGKAGWQALVGDKPLKASGSEEPARFESKVEAIAALEAFAAARAAAEAEDPAGDEPPAS